MGLLRKSIISLKLKLCIINLVTNDEGNQLLPIAYNKYKTNEKKNIYTGARNMTKRIILLNGPSSSGKSTLASTLQTIIKDEKDIEYGIISIVDFLEMTTDKEIFNC